MESNTHVLYTETCTHTYTAISNKSVQKGEKPIYRQNHPGPNTHIFKLTLSLQNLKKKTVVVECRKIRGSARWHTPVSQNQVFPRDKQTVIQTHSNTIVHSSTACNTAHRRTQLEHFNAVYHSLELLDILVLLCALASMSVSILWHRRHCIIASSFC